MTQLDQIDTVVLVMMENRSFDHLLGWMSLPAYGGRSDVDGLKGELDPGTRELTDPAYDNYALNQRWRPYVVAQDRRLATDLPHARAQIADQLAFDAAANRFRMNGFARSYFAAHPDQQNNRPESLMVFPPDLLPMTSFLAKNFCVCDRWFAPVPADTHPNRLMSLSGYTNTDATSNHPPDQFLVIDWCEKNKVRWHVYHEGFSFLTLLRKSTIFHPNFRKFGDLANDILHDGDAQFPQVILIEPAYDDDPFVPAPDDNHPPLPMAPGEAFLLRVYKALISNPARWSRMVVIFTYDEHGGFYDHVPPIAVQTGTADNRYPAFTTSGARVPAIVASPFVKPGSVFKGNLDHTSILRFLAEKFTPGVPYSEPVQLRHQGGLLNSVGAVVGTAAPLATPAPPALGTFHSVVHAEPRLPVTPNQHAFAAARAAAFDDPAELRKKHPGMLFERKLPHS